MEKIYHKQINKKGMFGGLFNTTLCGRVNNFENEKNDGMNVDENFTCKFCLKASKTKWGQKIIENSDLINDKSKVGNNKIK